MPALSFKQKEDPKSAQPVKPKPSGPQLAESPVRDQASGLQAETPPAEQSLPLDLKRALTRFPPLSHAAVRLHTLKVDDDNLKVIADLIYTDPALSALLLRLVNSPLFGLQCRVNGILQAVSLMGTERVRALATTAAFRILISTALDLPAPTRCWRHSVASALASRELAGNEVDSDAAYTGGLLHDIGCFAMLSTWPKEYAQLLSVCHPAELKERELETLHVTHNDAGAFLLQHWGLPAQLVEVAREHHSSEVKTHPKLVEVVSRGCRVADAIGFAVTEIAPQSDGVDAMLTGRVFDPPNFRERIAEGIRQIECL